MNIVKTTINLTNAEEVKELLKANPEIRVTLSEEAAAQVVRELSDDLTDAIEYQIGKAFSSSPFLAGNDVMRVWKDDEGLRIQLGDVAKMEIRDALKTYATEAIRRCCQEDVKTAYQQAIKTVMEKIDPAAILADMKKAIYAEVMRKVREELVPSSPGTKEA